MFVLAFLSPRQPHQPNKWWAPGVGGTAANGSVTAQSPSHPDLLSQAHNLLNKSQK